MAAFDRPRTIVKKSGKGRDVEQFNATFAQGIVDLGVGVEMCAARSGWQEGHRLPALRPERGQAALLPHPPRRTVAEDDPGAVRVGSRPHQGLLPAPSSTA
jgi:hypothetical protein